jgi:hypothetical protein
MGYLYYEPIKGQVYRFKILKERENSFSVLISDHEVEVEKSYLSSGGVSFGGGVLWPETQEWLDRYQDSLSVRVSQHQLTVYYVMPKKQGKNNTRVLVIDGCGATYTVLVPTWPLPQFGQSLEVYRFDLEVVSVVPAKDLLEKVMEARNKNSLL